MTHDMTPTERQAAIIADLEARVTLLTDDLFYARASVARMTVDLEQANRKLDHRDAEIAALRAALDAQMKYQRDLRADRDRLDWIMKHCASFPITNRNATDVTHVLPLRSAIDDAMGLMPKLNLRAAIDAARKEQP